MSSLDEVDDRNWRASAFGVGEDVFACLRTLTSPVLEAETAEQTENSITNVFSRICSKKKSEKNKSGDS